MGFVTATELSPPLVSALLTVVGYDHKLRGVRGRDSQEVKLLVTELETDPSQGSVTPRTPQPAATPVSRRPSGTPFPSCTAQKVRPLTIAVPPFTTSNTFTL